MNNLTKLKRYVFWKLKIDKIIVRVTKIIGIRKNYEWIFKFIDNNSLESCAIVEIGSRDALDSISMLKNLILKKLIYLNPVSQALKVFKKYRKFKI